MNLASSIRLLLDALDFQGRQYQDEPALDVMKTVSNEHRSATPQEKQIIAASPNASYLYARYVLKREVPAGEAAIATDPQYAYLYARYVVNGPFPEGEAAILTSPEWIYHYAENCLRERWTEAEPIVMASNYRYLYSRAFFLPGSLD